jgi:hypothetical protein
MAEEPREILRRTRVEIQPFLRELSGHNRAIIPRIEIARRWMSYYEALGRTRRLTRREQARFEEQTRLFNVYSSRRELLRVAGRYGRTHKPPDLIALRQAQANYYESQAETLPPAERKRVEEAYVPPKEQYDEWADLQQDIEAKCKRYLAVKFREAPYQYLTSLDRYMQMQSLGELLRQDYVRAYDLGEAEKSLSDLVREYRETKERGRGR